MATRDLHDQKILRALEGIEKQLKIQNMILKDVSNKIECIAKDVLRLCGQITDFSFAETLYMQQQEEEQV